MSLSKQEIKESYKWITSGTEECIVLEKKYYDSFMNDDGEVSVIKVDGCDTKKILEAYKDTFKNAKTIIISFVTSKEYNFLTMSMLVEDIAEDTEESCEVLFTSHPDETMSNDECSVTMFVK